MLIWSRLKILFKYEDIDLKLQVSIKGIVHVTLNDPPIKRMTTVPFKTLKSNSEQKTSYSSLTRQRVKRYRFELIIRNATLSIKIKWLQSLEKKGKYTFKPIQR